MKSRRYFNKSLMIGLCILPFMAGCKDLIDDNLDDCAAEVTITYEMRLITNFQTEIASELSDPGDVYAREALESYVKPVFTDFGHDLDLSFYGVEADSVRLHHQGETMDASQKSYTLSLPVQHYTHNAAANIKDNGVVEFQNENNARRQALTQQKRDSVETHKTGLFVGCLKDMELKAGASQSFSVTLDIINSATALVVDTTGSKLKQLKVYSTGFASSFKLADGVYNHSSSPIVKNDELNVTGGSQRCFAAVNYPSKDTPGSKVVVETTEPFISVGGEETLWEWHCYCPMPDGTVTRTVLSMKTPLRAGQLEILKARLYDDGVIRTDNPSVGISVTLDWKPGGDYDPGI